MIQGKWFPQQADITLPLALREGVFGRGRDALDEVAQQVVVYDDGLPVGAARLWWADGAFRIGDVGVVSSWRGKGFGDLLVRLLLFKALSHSASRVELVATGSAASFFARYGFKPAGPEAQEGAPMFLLAENIVLSHCQGGCAGGEGCNGDCSACEMG